MAVGSGVPYSAHTGNGITTAFAYGFTLLDAADLTVKVGGVVVSGYTVSGVGTPAGGSVVFPVAPASGVLVELIRDVGLSRLTDYQSNGDLAADTLNADLDRLWMAGQQASLTLDRSMRAPLGEVVGVMPAAALRAGKLLSFDGSGNPVVAAPVGGSATDLALSLSLPSGAADIGRGAGTVESALEAVEAAAAAAQGDADAAATDAAAALAQERAVVNILPNTRWLVATALGTATKQGATGLALGPLTVSSYTTGSNLVVCSCSDTSNAAVGQIVTFSAAAHASMKLTPCRIMALTPNVSFTVRLPNGAVGASSAACTATIVDAGASASAGSGNSFDGWSKTPTLQVWRDSWSANVRAGSRYACGMKKGDAAAELHYVQIDPRDVPALAGKTLSFGAWVKCPAGGSWRLFTADSISGMRYSAARTTTGYTWMEFSFAVPAGVTTLSMGLELSGALNQVFYLSEPFAGQGNLIGSNGGPPTLRREVIIPTVKYSPVSFFNANITLPTTADAVGSYSFVFDAYAETGGMLAPEVRAIDILLEGINFNAVITGTGGRFFATRDVESDPIKYGPLFFQQVAQVKVSAAGLLTLGADGTARVYGLSGDNWANVSMDINGVVV